MQPLCQLLVRVRLDAQSFADTEHLEEEGQLSFGSVRVLFDDGFAQVLFRARGEDLREGSGRGGLVRRQGDVGPHPELHEGMKEEFQLLTEDYITPDESVTDLGIRLAIVGGKVLDTSFSELSRQAGRADLAPVIRLNAWGDLEDGLKVGHLVGLSSLDLVLIILMM